MWYNITMQLHHKVNLLGQILIGKLIIFITDININIIIIIIIIIIINNIKIKINIIIF